MCEGRVRPMDVGQRGLRQVNVERWARRGRWEGDSSQQSAFSRRKGGRGQRSVADGARQVGVSSDSAISYQRAGRRSRDEGGSGRGGGSGTSPRLRGRSHFGEAKACERRWTSRRQSCFMLRPEADGCSFCACNTHLQLRQHDHMVLTILNAENTHLGNRPLRPDGCFSR
jgi:hypothetical protein